MKEEETIEKNDSSISVIILAFSPLLFVIIFGLIYQYYKHQSLKENGEYTKAVIYDFTKSRSRKSWNHYYNYSYIVDGVKYEGSAGWNPKKDIYYYVVDSTMYKQQKFNIGDTVIIMYNKKDPAYSKTKRNIDANDWLNNL